MRRMHRFCRMLLIWMLVCLPGFSPALADTGNVEIQCEIPGHQYRLYQIFSGHMDSQGMLTNPGWGSGFDEAGLIRGIQEFAYYMYTANNTRPEPIRAVIGTSRKIDTSIVVTPASAAAAMDYIAAHRVIGESTWCAELWKALKGAASGGISMTYDAERKLYVSGPVPAGFYVITDTVASTDTTDLQADITRVMTVGDSQTVQAIFKNELPTVKKDVYATATESLPPVHGGSWTEGASFSTGDSVWFRLEGFRSTYIDGFEEYTLSFHDTLPSGMTFEAADSERQVYVYYGDTPENMNWRLMTEAQYTVQADSGSVHVSIPIVTDGKKVKPYQSCHYFRVLYRATLNTQAVTGTAGNVNTVYGEYSNDPTNTGTGRTAPDTAVAYTFGVCVKKTDESGNPLGGAAFALERYNAGTAQYEAVGSLPGDGATLTEFRFTGLGAGTYRLTETSAPPGYNQLEAPICFEIRPVMENGLCTGVVFEETGDSTSGSQNQQAAGETVSFTVSQGIGETTIVNRAGAVLPSTGGPGTRMFILAGAGLMVVSALLLQAMVFSPKREKRRHK